MNVGFYYHVGVATRGGVAAPAHVAMFVEELARQAGSVTYLAHSGPPSETDDTLLTPPLVRTVDLGPRRSAPARLFLPRLRALDLASIDVMLVRAPTPLLPAMLRVAPRAAVLLVGAYERSSRSQSWWRKPLVDAWVASYERRQRRAVRGKLVLANSPALAGDASRWGAEVVEVFTSSLSHADLDAVPVADPRFEDGHPVRLLFTGRVCEEKGLLDAVDAVAILSERGREVRLEIVGPADDDRFVRKLEARARARGVAGQLRLRGYLPAGPALLEVYASADAFLMPSRADAFPRSLIEALAVGVPAVATRVGGIPLRLTHERTALLVEPGSPQDLADAVERLVTDDGLRSTLVEQGKAWARGFTNERSCALIVDRLRKLVEDPRHLSTS